MLKRLFLFSAWPILAAVVCAVVLSSGFARSRASLHETHLPSSIARDSAPDRSADNPAVAPGKVRWHDSFAQAQAASKQSGKPVLLFQMMGRLDRQFC